MKTSTFILLLAFLSQSAFSQEVEDICAKAKEVTTFIDSSHYSPRAMDDEWSQLFFKKIMNYLDVDNDVIISDAYLNFKQKHENNIDDYFKSQDCEFVIELTDLYETSLAKWLGLAEEITYSDLDIHMPSTFYLNKRPQSDRKLKEIIMLNLKSAVIADVALKYPKIGSTKEISNTEILEIFEKRKEDFICNFKSRMSFVDVDRMIGELILTVIGMVYDDHTLYLSSEYQKAYLSDLSNHVYSYGLVIGKNKRGDFEISDIIAGSEPWYKGEIKKGDILNAIKLKDGKRVDFDCFSESDLQLILSDPHISELTFVISRKRKKEKEYTLTKSQESNRSIDEVLSYVFDGSMRIGYIYLPSFYGYEDPNNLYSNGCADHIALELLRLTSDEKNLIDGIILDLRGNEGGSIDEATKITGMFTEQGSLGLTKYKDQKEEVLYDSEHEIDYNGPLMIYIDEMSASASELTAAALQDHNRALIVGSPSYGKGSIQAIYPLDMDKYLYGDGSDIDIVKVTQGTFCRPNGQAIQNHGVTPDMVIPYTHNANEEKSSKEDQDMVFKNIELMAAYDKAPALPKHELIKLSNARVVQSKYYKEIKRISSEITKIETEQKLSISLNETQERNRVFDRLDTEAAKKNTLFKVEMLKIKKDMMKIGGDDFKFHKKTMDAIEKDPDTQEAYSIMKDFILLERKREKALAKR